MGDIAFKTTMEFTYGVPAPIGPGVVRLVAPNPSPLTFKGTNTYLVGSLALAVIDPGPDDTDHIASIMAAANGRSITHIFSTHAHRDHVDGIARLKRLTAAMVVGFARTSEQHAAMMATPSGKAFVDTDFRPDVALKDHDVISGGDWALEAIHTPGHAPDHACYALAGRRIVFSGDHVMAWNTSVVAPPEGRMADYIRSLEILMDRDDDVFLPGHGGRLTEPQRTVKAYLLHRRWREQAIVAELKRKRLSIHDLVPLIYGSIAKHLIPAATLSVQAHVEYLMERGLVASDGPLTFDCAIWPV